MLIAVPVTTWSAYTGYTQSHDGAIKVPAAMPASSPNMLPNAYARAAVKGSGKHHSFQRNIDDAGALGNNPPSAARSVE